MLKGHEGLGDSRSLFVFYGLGYGAIFATLALQYGVALRSRAELQLNEVEVFLTRAGIVQMLLQTGVALLSIAMAVAGVGMQTGAPGWVYAGIGPLMMVHGIWEGRGVARLQAGTVAQS